MTSRLKTLAARIALASVLGAGSLAAGTAALAARPAGSQPPGSSPSAALQLGVDNPIMYLGETVHLTGRHFTPGAQVTIYVHGPFTAGLGPVYGHRIVDRLGTWTMPLTVASYPDKQARLNHNVIVAAASAARVGGVQEGGAVLLQVDPMPGIDLTTRGALTWASLVIQGTAVKARVTARDATHYRVSYAGHLRAGLYSAYLKWGDAAGAYGARAWSFRIGNPFSGPGLYPVEPRLSVDKTRIRLGESIRLSGQYFTPGALVTINLSGPNGPPHRYGTVIADGWGNFTLRVTVPRYPDANARRSAAIVVGASASDAPGMRLHDHPDVVGDLPEEVALLLMVAP